MSTQRQNIQLELAFVTRTPGEAEERVSIMLRDVYDFYRKNPVRPEVIELRNMAIAARLLIECAKRRTESRGLHYNVDYPEKNDKYYLKDTIIRRGEI